MWQKCGRCRCSKSWDPIRPTEGERNPTSGTRGLFSEDVRNALSRFCTQAFNAYQRFRYKPETIMPLRDIEAIGGSVFLK